MNQTKGTNQSLVINHNDTLNKQGGTTDQYYHLSQSAYDWLFEQDQFVKSISDVMFNSVTPQWVAFDPVPSGVPSGEGIVSWNGDELSLDVDTGKGAVLQVGQEFWFLIYNDTGVPITNGEVLRPVGATLVGSLVVPTVELAQADIFSSCEGTIMLATIDIPDGEVGLATRAGRIRGVNTSGLSIGADAYLSETIAGALTNDRPAFPNYEIKLGASLKSGTLDGEFAVSQSTQISDTVNNAWNGCFRESFDFLVTSSVGIVTGSLTPTNGHPDMTMMFSDGFTMLVTTPADTIELTAGADDIPIENFIFITKANKVLEKSLVGFPTGEEHIKVATVVLQTATTTENDGALKNQNWNDHIQDTTTNQGHLSHITEKLRQFEAQWSSGALGALTTDGTDVTVDAGVGVIYQLHKQLWTAKDTAGSDKINIVNNLATPYVAVQNLNTQTLDALGGTLANYSFSFVMWGVQNKTGEVSHLMLNLPTGHYAKNDPDSAVSDALNYSFYDIPNKFQGAGFLIARFTMTLEAGGTVWTLEDTEDLRGKIPNTTSGGGGGGGGVSAWTALEDTPASFSGQAGRFPIVNVGEDALEFSVPTLAEVLADITSRVLLDGETRNIVNGSFDLTTSGDLNGGDITALGTLTAGGSFSKLKLNSNLTDNSDDEYGIRVVDGVLYGRFGDKSVRVQSLGVGIEMRAIVGCGSQEIATTFGETFSTPIDMSLAIPSQFPVIPCQDVGGDIWVAGSSYKYQGGEVPYNTAGYYFNDEIDHIVGAYWILNTAGYMKDIHGDGDFSNQAKIDHAGVVGVNGFEIAGKLDVSNCSLSNGFGYAYDGLSGDDGVDPDIVVFNIGFNSTTAFSDNITVSIGGGAGINTGILRSVGISSYRVLVTNVRTGLIDYEVWINGVKTNDVTDFVVAVDINSITDWFFAFSTVTFLTFEGVIDIKDYGYVVKYTVD